MGATTCTACPAYSTAPPERSAATAYMCIAGSSGLNGGPTCNLCVEGKHQANIGSEVCDDCVAGKWLADSGSADSADCIGGGRGNYSIQAGAISEDTCDVCASGKYLDLEGNDAESDCDHCPAKFGNNPAASTARSDCKCNSGSSGLDSGLCTQCLAGKYKIASGDAECTNCPAGKYSRAVGATSDVCQAFLVLSCPANTSASRVPGARLAV